MTLASEMLHALRAPIITQMIDCETCMLGCSSDYHPAEACPLLPRDYPTGAQLATRGDAIDYVWFVKSGAVGGTWGVGRETQILFLPGSVVGLESLVSKTRLVTAWTLSRTTVCAFERETFHSWLERRSALADQFRVAANQLAAAASQSSRSP